MQPSSSECPGQHLSAGNGKEEFAHTVPMETTGGMMETTSSIVTPARENSTPAVGSDRRNKRTTLKDKKQPCKKRTRRTKSSQTSDQDSILNERDCYEWWTTSCEETSKKLWFPTGTDCVDSPSTSLSGCVSETIPVSWSKIRRFVPRSLNSQKILWPLYTSSLVATTGCAATQPRAKTNSKTTTATKTTKKNKPRSKKKLQEREVIRCQRIRLRPSHQQARVLRFWMKGARDTYNQALRLVKDGKAKPNKLLKKLVVTRRTEDSEKVKKMKEVPSGIRSRAVLDLIDAHTSALAGFKKRQRRKESRWKKRKGKKAKRRGKEKKGKRRRWKRRKPFEVKFKSRRLTQDSFGFESNSLRFKGDKCYLFSTRKKFDMSEGIKMSEPFRSPSTKPGACCRLQYTYGRWYLLVPFVDIKTDEVPTERFAALDPGVRTFQTYYTEDEAGEVGIETERKIDGINKKIKKIASRMKEVRGKKKNQLRKAWYRANARSSHLVDDLHWKVIKYLLDRFDVIVAPTLNVHNFDKSLRKVVRERMTTHRHGLFSRRLKMKAETRGKVVITDFEEHGTSRTCSTCGEANHDLGSSKVFWCVRCGFEGDRDVNSAKNHALKFLVGNNNY